MIEDGKPMPLGETINVETIEFECDDNPIIMCPQKEAEINFTLDYFNQNYTFRALFRITNNYRRMHGGFPLRERNRYKVHKRYKGVKRK